MKKGDRFYTIAYTYNTRVIEAEVIDVGIIGGEEFIYFQNIDRNLDKWCLRIDVLNNWKFSTRSAAEKRLSEF